MWGNSVSIEGPSVGFWDYYFDNNTINDKPLTYLKGIADSSVNCSSYGEIILFDCENVTLYDGNFSDVSVGICAGYSYYTSIENCTFSNTGMGLILELCWYSNVSNCSFSEYTEYAMKLASSQYLRIFENQMATTSFSGTGVRILGADNSIVEDNDISGGYSGIDLYTRNGDIIRNNSIRDCVAWGIRASSHFGAPAIIETNKISSIGDSGIWLYYTGNSTITGNRIEACGNNGMYIAGAEDFNITDNLIIGSGGFGIQMINDPPDNTTQGVVYNNLIGWNQLGNAYDDGDSNQWDNGAIGNSWSDYIGSGSYTIPGEAGSIDNFPQMLDDSSSPSLTSPDDVLSLLNGEENKIEWSITEDYPKDYTLYRNETIIDTGSVPYSMNISLLADTSFLGTFNYTLVVTDCAGNTASDQVLVEIIQYLPHDIISITSDLEFATQASLDGWEGDGSSSTPYIIENYRIISPGASPAILITWISEDTHYIIRNCRVSNFTSLEVNTGAIKLFRGQGVVSGCEIHDCSQGIYIQDIGKTIEYNQFRDCSNYALTGKDAYYAVVKGNSFSVTGNHAMYWQQCDNSIIENNEFLADITGGPIHQLEDQNSVGLTIRNNLIITSGGDFFLTSDDVLFEKNHVQVYDQYGLTLRHNQGLTITDCVFEKIGGIAYSKGVFAAGPSSSNIVIANSTFQGLGFTVWNIANCSVYNCSVSDAYQTAIAVEEMVDITLIFNNTIANSIYKGIYIDYRSRDVQIFNNHIEGISEGNGIELRSNLTQVYNNTVNNCQRGISTLFDACDNFIFSNNLYSNGENAHDSSSGHNTWDDAISKGNYYDNFDGLTPVYSISGIADAVDRYPMRYSSPGSPAIVAPDWLEFHEGEEGADILWVITDTNPASFQLFVNGTFDNGGSWISGEAWSTSIEGLPMGLYYYTMHAYDLTGLLAVKIVWVNVTSPYDVHAPIVITQNSDFETQGWPGDGTAVSPYVIQYLNITSGYPAIEISNTTAYFIIQYCTYTDEIIIKNATHGSILRCIATSGDIRIENSEFMHIEGNVVNGIDWGIYLYNCSASKLIGNEIYATFVGIRIWNCTEIEILNHDLHNFEACIDVRHSQYVTIEDNYLHDSAWGLYVEHSFKASILNNCIADNFENGVEMRSCEHSEVMFNEFIHNALISGVEGVASIKLVSCVSSLISSNNVTFSDFHGIYVDGGCNNLTIVLNRLGWNIEGNAMDNGSVNFWDNGTIGNWWEDLGFSIEYVIPGSAGSVDHYPFGRTPIPPIADSPDDVVLYYGSWGQSITWSSYDDNPLSYEIIRDGTVLDIYLWSFGQWNISVNLDGLNIGSYNYTINLIDADGIYTTDTVWVTVLEDTEPPTIDSPDDVWMMDYDAGVNITWHPADNNPCYYEIYRNGSVITWGEWNSSMTYISISLDGLPAGFYEYMLLVSDCVFNTTDTVFATVEGLDTSPPTINSPPDVVYYVGNPGFNITWYAYDENPEYYQILLNDTLVEDGFWNGSGEAISIFLVGLDVGLCIYGIEVMDAFGNNATDEVTVLVLDERPSISSPEDIEYIQGTTGHEITWELTSGIAHLFDVYRNGSVLVSQSWYGDVYTINVDYLFAGSYNYTIRVFGFDGESVVDTVWVNVTSEDTTVTTTTELFDLGSLSLIVTWVITIWSFVIIIVFSARIYQAHRRFQWTEQLG